MSYHRPIWEAIERGEYWHIDRVMSGRVRRTVAVAQEMRDAAYIVHAPVLRETLEELVMALYDMTGGMDGQGLNRLSPRVQAIVRARLSEPLAVLQATNTAARGEGPSVHRDAGTTAAAGAVRIRYTPPRDRRRS